LSSTKPNNPMPDESGDPYVVGMGWALLDYLVLAETFPQENTKTGVDLWEEEVGGPSVRAILTAMKLGVDGALVTAVGSDQAGETIRNELAASGVNIQELVVARGVPTRRSGVWLSKKLGTRTVVYTMGGPELVQLSDSQARLIAGARVLHLDGRDLRTEIAAARCARKSGVQVSVDVGSVKSNIGSLLDLANVVIISRDSLREIAGERSLEEGALGLLESDSTDVIVVTAGSEGSMAYLSTGESFHEPAFQVPAIDTNGAGDTFAGAVVWGLANDVGIRRNLRLASACAALKCTRVGNSGLPTLAEVLKLAGEDD